MGNDFSPREIVSELDKHIVGQQDAKRAVAIALRNRWRRLQLAEGLREEVLPKNILMIGPTLMMFFGTISSRSSSFTCNLRQRLRSAIATARLALCWPTMCLSSSATICFGVRSDIRALRW